MSTHSKTKQQVYIELEKLGFNSSDIEQSLIACQSQGLLYNLDWCCYYLAHLKDKIQMDRNTNTYNCNPTPHAETIDNTHMNLSDLNETIFSELQLSSSGFILNGHASERHKRILERINKIYDILFDYLYETQRQMARQRRVSGVGGRLSKYVMRNMVFSQVILDDTMANTFCSILKLPSSCNILKIDYGRDEFNLLLRLLCAQQECDDEMDESVVASVIDYKQNIVKLPHLHIPTDFIHYLSHRNAFKPQQQLSLSSATQLSLQYALGPPLEETECEEEKSSLINLCSLQGAADDVLSHLFNFYSSQYAHTFIEEGNDYNYIPQEATVELFLSSSLAQHILEVIWNEAKPLSSSQSVDGLNESQFICACQLIALAQHNEAYTKHHLLKKRQVPLPSIYVNASFVVYFAQHKQRETSLTQLIPYIPESHIDNFLVYFSKLDRKKRGYVSGSAIGRFFRKSGLNESILAQVWDLSDMDNDGRLSSNEFCVAMHLINCVRQGAPLPTVLPRSLLPAPQRTEAFEAHLNLCRLSALRISQFVDYRDDNGKYCCAQIVDIRQSNLLLRRRESTFWCDYHTEMWRIAAHKSITQRGVTRKEMMSYRVGDRIDINPYHTDALRGWKLGNIIDLSFGQACVSLHLNNAICYWVHLDNPMESSPPHKHTPKKHHKKHHKKRASDLTKQETQQIIECIESTRKKHSHKECDGYRSPFREFEQNPNKKLKLLPQDSSASETAGFVMINYPQTAAGSPAIQFGSAQTDKEVQYVLKTLNIDHNKRHTLPMNAQIFDNKRKNSAFTTHHHQPYYTPNGHRYQSNNNLTQHYSNTAPSTPIKLTRKRFKYRKSHQPQKTHRAKSSSARGNNKKHKKSSKKHRKSSKYIRKHSHRHRHTDIV
eukprot:66340_1